ncbi:unnamed protein product [Pleuronectes platessa]|uniref:Uncharacterized protein n=1 Tax=Pleuronectes platessa TaxID=8262 RepID=A0A9N7Y9P5_PLEPL|nr:unnamed protein product [Pleuronectes platessa]
MDESSSVTFSFSLWKQRQCAITHLGSARSSGSGRSPESDDEEEDGGGGEDEGDEGDGAGCDGGLDPGCSRSSPRR